MPRRTFAVAATSFALVAGAIVVAGPLDPPSGPVAPTYKTLTDIEPRTVVNAINTPGDNDLVYRIAQAGSYYLTSNMVVGSGKVGIEIASNNVTLDLGGFSIVGLAGSLDGVSVGSSVRKRIVVRNGTVMGMGRHGVSLVADQEDPAQSANHVIEDLTVSGCGGTGTEILSGTVRNSQFNTCGSWGLTVQGHTPSLVTGCTAAGNTGAGINVSNGVIADCAARSNTGTGIAIGNAGVIRDCLSEANRSGFNIVNCTITGCTALNNTAYGIASNARSNVIGNYVVSTTLVPDSVGIFVGFDANRIEDNNIVTQVTAIRVTGANNFIVRNTFRFCTAAMNAPAGNRVGTILPGAGSGAINGNSGGGLGTNDPYANFIY